MTRTTNFTALNMADLADLIQEAQDLSDLLYKIANSDDLGENPIIDEIVRAAEMSMSIVYRQKKLESRLC